MDKKTVIAVVIAVILVGVLIGGSLWSKLTNTNQTQNTNVAEQNTQNPQLNMKDIVVGTGDLATAGKVVTVHYTGTLTDGTKFDSSIDAGTPFTFNLGAGQVIKGWEMGIEGMKVGGKRVLVIPPHLAYGANAVGPIPANSTLIFQVELLGVK